MKIKSLVIAGVSALALSAVVAAPALAKTFKFAFQGDAQSLDPHSLNETFTLGMLANVYEPLIDYDRNMKKNRRPCHQMGSDFADQMEVYFAPGRQFS